MNLLRNRRRVFPWFCTLAFCYWIVIGTNPACGQAQPESQVSYYSDIRPIFQQNCFGCHQGAKQGGQYVMTDFALLLAGGESGVTAVVPGQPDSSYLMELIEVVDGAADMPRDADPLKESDVEKIRAWILAGAENDTPEHAALKFDQQHPPTYQSLPTVTSMDVSPDGRWLAVAAYHEVILHDLQQTSPTGGAEGQQPATASDDNADASSPLRRLIGLSERIESVAFSPDGKRLAVTGGSPGRMGEVQIWDLEQDELELSKQVGYDTLYGASWSSDGSRVAFGCPDSTVRAINTQTGAEILFNGAHNDWVLDTTFSTKDDHLITVSRDMSMKLIKVETQRFVDNITSITPGALKGGLNAVDCHPEKDVLLAGGADGSIRIYKMLRDKARKIGDDFNLIRAYPALTGRVFDTCFSADGNRVAAVSSFNGQGQLKVFETESGKELLSIDVDSGGLFSVCFYQDNSQVVIAGFDGIIRLIDIESSKTSHQFPSAPIAERAKVDHE